MWLTCVISFLKTWSFILSKKLFKTWTFNQNIYTSSFSAFSQYLRFSFYNEQIGFLNNDIPKLQPRALKFMHLLRLSLHEALSPCIWNMFSGHVIYGCFIFNVSRRSFYNANKDLLVIRRTLKKGYLTIRPKEIYLNSFFSATRKPALNLAITIWTNNW